MDLRPANGGGGGLYSAMLVYEDQKASGTNGGTFTSGGWRTRDVNTEVLDTGNHGSVAANQITLDAGTYDFHIRAPAYHCDSHAARLQNVTDATTVKIGSTGFAGPGTYALTDSVIVGTLTIASGKTFEIQHQCGLTENVDGFGPEAGLGVSEIYTQAIFWKRA